MRWILDASAGIRIVYNQEIGAELHSLISNNIINAPDNYIAETGNGYWKYALYGNTMLNDALQMHEDSINLVDNYIPSYILSKRAMKISLSYKSSFYDSLYLSLAQLQDCGIISFDKKLVATAQSLGIKTI